MSAEPYGWMDGYADKHFGPTVVQELIVQALKPVTFQWRFLHEGADEELLSNARALMLASYRGRKTKQVQQGRRIIPGEFRVSPNIEMVMQGLAAELGEQARQFYREIEQELKTTASRLCAQAHAEVTAQVESLRTVLASSEDSTVAVLSASLLATVEPMRSKIASQLRNLCLCGLLATSYSLVEEPGIKLLVSTVVYAGCSRRLLTEADAQVRAQAIFVAVQAVIQSASEKILRWLREEGQQVSVIEPLTEASLRELHARVLAMCTACSRQIPDEVHEAIVTSLGESVAPALMREVSRLQEVVLSAIAAFTVAQFERSRRAEAGSLP